MHRRTVGALLACYCKTKNTNNTNNTNNHFIGTNKRIGVSMARTGTVTYEKVVDAILALRKENINVTIRSVRDRIGRGDFSKISKFITSFLEAEAKQDEVDACISDELHEKLKTEIRTNVQLARDKDLKSIANLTTQCSELQELLVRSEQDRMDAASALDALRVEKAATEGACMKELSLLRERIEESGKTSGNLRSQIEKVLEQLARSEQERVEIAYALEAMKVEKATTGAAYKTELSLLRGRVDESEKTSVDLRSQTEKVSEQLREQHVFTALAQENVQRLEASLAEAHQLQTKLADENQQLKMMNVGLEKDLNACQADSRALKTCLDRSEKQLEAQQDEIRQLYLKQERITAEHSNVRETNAGLETMLAEMEKSDDQEKRRKTTTTTTILPPPPPPAGSPACP